MENGSTRLRLAALESASIRCQYLTGGTHEIPAPSQERSNQNGCSCSTGAFASRGAVSHHAAGGDTEHRPLGRCRDHVLQQAAFTGTIARGLSLIAIVIGGLMFAFGEGGSKRALAGIVFGLGMTLGAANFIDWLF